MLPLVFGALALGGLVIAAFASSTSTPSPGPAPQGVQPDDDEGEPAPPVVPSVPSAPVVPSTPATPTAPTREVLEDAASNARENEDHDLADELDDRAQNAPSQTEVADQEAVQQGTSLESEISRMTPAQRSAYEAILMDEEPANLPRMRQAALALDAQGFPQCADEIEAHISDVASAPAPVGPPPVNTPSLPSPQSTATPTGPVSPATAPVPLGPNPGGPTANDLAENVHQTAAQSIATAVAANVRAKRYSYDRALMRSFQTHAGIDADGLYGPSARAALVYYLGRLGLPASAAPAALFQGRNVGPYTPPG